MDVQKAIASLRRNGYEVNHFSRADEAVAHVLKECEGKSVGFGGSQTLTDLGMLEKLRAQGCTVVAPDFHEPDVSWFDAAVASHDTDIFMCSANGISENGEVVNLDETGNRVAESIFGHERVILVVGTNKISPDLEQTVWRVRNVAAPANCKRFNLPTPCVRGKETRCYDCNSPSRFCRDLLISLRASGGNGVTEIVLIDEDLGF